MKCAAFGATDCGLQREQNEDAYLVDAERGLFAVADGLGGLPRGELASQLVIEAISKESLEGADWEERAVVRINEISQYIKFQGIKIAGVEGIATTLTAAQIVGNLLRILHVGDCSAFICVEKQCWRLTRDQTVAEDMRDDGCSDIPEHYEHTLTQCVGQDIEVIPQLIEIPFPPEAKLLICSDGITSVISDKEIIVALRMAEHPQSIVGALIEAANDRGGPDNATVVAVYNQPLPVGSDSMGVNAASTV